MQEMLLPLFPLEVVLLPEEPLPLHIFEERYKTMIGDCLEAKETGQGPADFGVVLLKGQELHTLGCTAHIVDVTSKYEDGRMDILTVGKRRFEILETDEERPYLRGTVEFFDDEGPDSADEAEAAFAIERFREVLRQLRNASEMPVHLPHPYHYLSFRLAAALPLGLEFKQQLLSLRHEPQRLKLIVRAMGAILDQLQRTRQAESKAGGNGNIRH